MPGVRATCLPSHLEQAIEITCGVRRTSGCILGLEVYFATRSACQAFFFQSALLAFFASIAREPTGRGGLWWHVEGLKLWILGTASRWPGKVQGRIKSCIGLHTLPLPYEST